MPLLAVVVALACICDSMTSAQPGLQGWSTAPDTLSARERSAIVEACHIRGPALIDRRGISAAARPVRASPGDQWCFLADLTKSHHASHGVRPLLDTARNSTAALIDLTLVHAYDAHAAHTTRRVVAIAGSVDGSIARVDVVTPVGNLRASVDRGHFLAWWPGQDAYDVIVMAENRQGQIVAEADVS